MFRGADTGGTNSEPGTALEPTSMEVNAERSTGAPFATWGSWCCNTEPYDVSNCSSRMRLRLRLRPSVTLRV